MSISQPEPQSPQEREYNRLRTEREHQVQLDQIEESHRVTAILRQEYEDSNVGAVARASRAALKEMTKAAA
jgi:hypothetical protein